MYNFADESFAALTRTGAAARLQSRYAKLLQWSDVKYNVQPFSMKIKLDVVKWRRRVRVISNMEPAPYREY